MRLQRYLVPPRLRTAEGADEERRATWLELFVDLVFVVAVGAVAQELVDDPSAGGFVRFGALFVPVWWAWVGVTFYADRFDTDDVAFRLLMLGEMLGVAALASTTGGALHGSSTGYALAFIAVRAILVAAYARAWVHVPAARGLTSLYTSMFAFNAGLWAVSLAFPTPQRYVLWVVGLVLDMGTPLAARRRLEQVPVSASHIPERIGLFTIIVLGESIIAVVAGTIDADWTARALVAAIGGFASAGAIWWIYFDTLDTSLFKRSLAAGQIYLYMHLPLLAGLTAAGAGVELAIHDAAGGALSEGTHWALFGGIAVTLASMAVIHFTTTRMPRERDLWLRIGFAAGALVLAAVDASVLVALPVLVTLLWGLVALELEHEAHGSAAEDAGA